MRIAEKERDYLFLTLDILNFILIKFFLPIAETVARPRSKISTHVPAMRD